MRRNLFALLLVGLFATPLLAQDASSADEPPAPALFGEPRLLTKAIDFAGRHMSSGEGVRDDGFYPKVGGMISGAGWISGGPGYRKWLFNGRAFADGHAAVSWRAYLKAAAVLEFPSLADGRLAAGVEALWQDSTQVNYFGLGPDSSEDPRGQYRLQTMNVVTYARYHARDWLDVSSRVGWLDRPSVASPTGPFKPDDAVNAQEIFPDDPAMTLARQPMFLHGGTALTADTRDFPDHPTRGSLYHASAGAYVADDRHYSFQRYEVAGLQALPIFNRAVVVLLRGWGLFTHAEASREVPFYLMPSLGGSYTLRGYSNYRFHDRQLLLGSVETRVALMEHVDGAVFVDSGTVAARVRDLGFDKTAYGFGLRLHTQRTTLARLDVAHTDEGWKMLFRSSDVFDLRRFKRWMAEVPFVP